MDMAELRLQNITSRRGATTRLRRLRPRVTIIIMGTTMTATAVGSHWVLPWLAVSLAVCLADSVELFQTLQKFPGDAVKDPWTNQCLSMDVSLFIVAFI
jgi:hypothetical protein